MKISVGAPFFDLAFTPFMALLAFLLPWGSALPWKRANLMESVYRLWGVMLFSLACSLAVWSLQSGVGILGPVGILLSKWFAKKRGVAMGAVMAGGSIGSLFFIPLLTFITLNYSWQLAWIIMELPALILCPLIVFLSENILYLEMQNDHDH